MDERTACAQLKSRFVAAGFSIVENVTFAEDGVSFEMDGFDREKRVGYEYISEEAGDSWDVDGAVIEALDERRGKGELFVLLVDEADAPDAAALDALVDEFLDGLPKASAGAAAAKSAAEATAGGDDGDAADGGDDGADDDGADDAAGKTAKKPAAKKPAKAAAKKPAAKAATKKPAAKPKTKSKK